MPDGVFDSLVAKRANIRSEAHQTKVLQDAERTGQPAHAGPISIQLRETESNSGEAVPLKEAPRPTSSDAPPENSDNDNPTRTCHQVGTGDIGLDTTDLPSAEADERRSTDKQTDAALATPDKTQPRPHSLRSLPLVGELRKHLRRRKEVADNEIRVQKDCEEVSKLAEQREIEVGQLFEQTKAMEEQLHKSREQLNAAKRETELIFRAKCKEGRVKADRAAEEHDHLNRLIDEVHESLIMG